MQKRTDNLYYEKGYKIIQPISKCSTTGADFERKSGPGDTAPQPGAFFFLVDSRGEPNFLSDPANSSPMAGKCRLRLTSLICVCNSYSLISSVNRIRLRYYSRTRCHKTLIPCASMPPKISIPTSNNDAVLAGTND